MKKASKCVLLSVAVFAMLFLCGCEGFWEAFKGPPEGYEGRRSRPADAPKQTSGSRGLFGSDDEIPLHLEGLSESEAAAMRSVRGRKKRSGVWDNSSFRDSGPVYSDELKSLNTYDSENRKIDRSREQQEEKKTEKWVF